MKHTFTKTNQTFQNTEYIKELKKVSDLVTYKVTANRNTDLESPITNYSFAFNHFIGPLINGIKEQQSIILNLQNQLKENKEIINQLKTSININNNEK